MNLLKEPWIPVRKGATFEQITYKELLCTKQPGLQVALPRDDLELACIQMLAAMTQVIFVPEDKSELRKRIETSLTEMEFDNGITKYIEWFDLNHPKWPFMQNNNTGAEKITPIQKMFPGLPAGNNHAFFNGKDEYNQICFACAAIGLFNLCTHTPNISGKHKGGLRGNSPISTMIFDENIRNMVWINVLSKESVDNTFIDVQSNKPVWIDALERKKQYFSMEIGIARGLFWVPVLIRLCSNNNLGLCDCCGNEVNKLVHGFLLGSDFMFEVTGLWPHPFSPRQLNLQKGNTKNKKKPDESIVSFKTTKPAWTQFSELLFSSEKTDKKEGYTPAPVISQYYDLCGDNVLRLLIGGYRNKQAAILQRRHELYSIPAGWNDKFRNRIIEIIEIGLDAEATLTDKVLYPLVKGKRSVRQPDVAIGH
jgi:CRISPR system Cascade subunit CasA